MMRAWDVVIASQRIRSAIDFARGVLSSINSLKEEECDMEFLACNTCSHHLANKKGKNIPFEPNRDCLAEKQLFAWVYVVAAIVCV